VLAWCLCAVWCAELVSAAAGWNTPAAASKTLTVPWNVAVTLTRARIAHKKARERMRGLLCLCPSVGGTRARMVGLNRVWLLLATASQPQPTGTSVCCLMTSVIEGLSTLLSCRSLCVMPLLLPFRCRFPCLSVSVTLCVLSKAEWGLCSAVWGSACMHVRCNPLGSWSCGAVRGGCFACARGGLLCGGGIGLHLLVAYSAGGGRRRLS